MNDELEDYAIKTVRELRDNGDLIASFFLCSAFVEHYNKTRLFVFITGKRKIEIIKVRDKVTKKMKDATIWIKMRKIIWKLSQGRVIEIGLLVGAWNHELFRHLQRFNKKRNGLVHKHENLLDILKKDDKEVRDFINLGMFLLCNIPAGYVYTEPKSHDK